MRTSRIFAGQSLLTVNDSVMGEFSFDLLIDESSIVRSTTIRAMGARKVNGWVKVMTRSLLDDDYVIQQAAMEALIGDRARGVPALLEFISKNPQNRISSLAKTELREGNTAMISRCICVALLLVLCPLLGGQQDPGLPGGGNSHHAIDEIGERVEALPGCFAQFVKDDERANQCPLRHGSFVHIVPYRRKTAGEPDSLRQLRRAA